MKLELVASRPDGRDLALLPGQLAKVPNYGYLPFSWQKGLRQALNRQENDENERENNRDSVRSPRGGAAERVGGPGKALPAKAYAVGPRAIDPAKPGVFARPSSGGTGHLGTFGGTAQYARGPGQQIDPPRP